MVDGVKIEKGLARRMKSSTIAVERAQSGGGGFVRVPRNVRGRSGGTNLKIGKADSTITAGSTGTVSVWQKNASTGTLEDTGDNVTVYLDWMHGSEDVSSGKQVLIARFSEYGGIWRVIGAECE